MMKEKYRRMSIMEREEEFVKRVLAPIVQRWITKATKSGEKVYGLGEDDLIRLKAKMLRSEE